MPGAAHIVLEAAQMFMGVPLSNFTKSNDQKKFKTKLATQTKADKKYVHSIIYWHQY